MRTTRQLHNDKTGFLSLFLILTLLTAVLLFLPKTAQAAEQQKVYKDDIYRYIITNEDKKEVTLIGFESADTREELMIPGTVSINQQVYTVRLVDISWEYYENSAYRDFYNSVSKLNFAENFQGTLSNPLFAFKNVRTIEFLGATAPQGVSVSISNRSPKPDVTFLVPAGTEAAYGKVITETMSYYNGSDLYEMDIPMTPTVIASGAAKAESGVFAKDGLLYQVTSSAKSGTGKVQLIGITSETKHSYLNLPEKLTNNGYTYELTRLCKFSLVHIGATVIVVPDTVTVMESSVFDKQVELLFLSKNCKVIPTNMITNENDESSLRFVYVPQGVTTISDKAFADIMKNEGSIILPTTIKSLGKQSLYSFQLVTFLNKKPIANLSAAIKSGTTVKVNTSVRTAYQKALGSKASVIAAKNVVKSSKLTVNCTNLELNTAQTATLKGTLTKGSNETVFWLSSDTGIFEVSSKGVVNPKKAGTAYAIAYTRTSGLYKAVKITITDKMITDGIFSYRVTDAARRTVSLCKIKPNATTKKVVIPEAITYNGKTYQVTGIIASPEDPGKPLIDEKYKNNKIETISFPKTITGVVGYLGELPSIKSITFLGKTAPESIPYWYNDGGLLAFQAVIYVPKGSVAAYTSALWLSADENTYSALHYGCMMDYNVVETGSDQPQHFVKDGILYIVTKKAGANSGEVAVKGADVTLSRLTINNTVTYGKYKYKVTVIYRGALDKSKAKEIIISDTVKIQK